LCCSAGGQPNLLLRLAQQGTAEQQVAFFNLLVTLLKLPRSAFGGTDTRERVRVMVATGAMEMLLSCSQISTTASASSVSGTAASNVSGTAASNVSGTVSSSSTSNTSSGMQQETTSPRDTSAALWLLLMVRCSLQWAAELAKMPERVIGGFTWVSTIQMAQQSQDPFRLLAPWSGFLFTLHCCAALQKAHSY
jgi:hypothetical protein